MSAPDLPTQLAQAEEGLRRHRFRCHECMMPREAQAYGRRCEIAPEMRATIQAMRDEIAGELDEARWADHESQVAQMREERRAGR